MNQRITILCLGIHQKRWRDLQTRLLRELAGDGICLEFKYFRQKGVKISKDILHFLQNNQPEILITTLQNYRDLTELESFWEEYQAQQVDNPQFIIPYLFLWEGKEKKTFTRIESLQIEDSVQIQSDYKQEVDPFFNFYGNYEINTSSLQSDKKDVTGYIFYKENSYFFPGIYTLVDGNGKKEVQPSHILLVTQFEQETPNFKYFVEHFRELCKMIQTKKILDHLEEDPYVLMKKVPLILQVDHEVVWKIFLFLLQKDGYIIQKTSSKTDHHPILRFGTQSFSKRPLKYSLPLPMSVQNVAGYKELKDDLTSFSLPPEEKNSSQQLKVEREILQEQIRSLQEKYRILSDAGKTKTNIEYRTMISQRKLDIIGEIVSRSVSWKIGQLTEYLEQATPTLVLLRNKEDEERFGYLIRASDKHLSLNLSDLDHLKKLFHLETDFIEAFIQDGIVISLESAKQEYTSKIEELRQELEEKKPSNLMDSASEVWEQLIQYQKDLNDFGRIEIWKKLEEYYNKIKTPIFEWFIGSSRQQSNKESSLDSLQQITIIADNLERGKALLSTLEKILPNKKTWKASLIVEPLEIDFSISKKTSLSQKDLDHWININLNRLEKYFLNLSEKLVKQKTDLLLCTHDLHLLYLFINKVWNEDDRIHIKKVVLLFSGTPECNQIKQLSSWNVRLDYLNSLRSRDKDYLYQILEPLLK